MKINDREISQADVMQRHHLYSDIDERMRHFGEIQSIAGELHRPVTEIAEFYEDVLESLRLRAQVPDYLQIFVSRKVRKQLVKSKQP